MDKLHINENKVRTLKYFLASFSYMSYKTCNCDRIIQGFIDVGILDAKHKFWPNFYAKKREEVSPDLKCKLLRNVFLNF